MEALKMLKVIHFGSTFLHRKGRGAGWTKVGSGVGGVIGGCGGWDTKVVGYSGGLKSEVT